jgi:SAM-dependent methyltransferase
MEPNEQPDHVAARHVSSATAATASAATSDAATPRPYILPMDEEEDRRLGAQHDLLRDALGSDFMCPLGWADAAPPRRVLDVGFGTSRWMRRAAERFPEADIVGLDLRPPTPGGEEMPPEIVRRCLFAFADLLAPLPLRDARFDYVHQRFMFAAIPAARWPGLLAELARVTRPGGWVELVEGGIAAPAPGETTPAPSVTALSAWTERLCLRRGIDLTLPARLPGLLSRDPRMRVAAACAIPIPLGAAFGGELGARAAENWLSARRHLRGAVLRAGLADAEEYDAAIAGVPAELATVRCVWRIYVCYAQRRAEA